MLHWSIVTHAKAREDAQGFGWELCQLALTRIPRQVSRARLECILVKFKLNFFEKTLQNDY
jgi:hypothetical protein